MKYLSPRRKEKRVVAAKTDTMLGQYSDDPTLVDMPVQKQVSVSESNKMKGGVIPSRGSHGSATRQLRSMTKDKLAWCTEGNHLIQPQAFVHGSSSRGYNFGTFVLGGVRVVEGRSGRSRSRRSRSSVGVLVP